MPGDLSRFLGTAQLLPGMPCSQELPASPAPGLCHRRGAGRGRAPECVLQPLPEVGEPRRPELRERGPGRAAQPSLLGARSPGPAGRVWGIGASPWGRGAPARLPLCCGHGARAGSAGACNSEEVGAARPGAPRCARRGGGLHPSLLGAQGGCSGWPVRGKEVGAWVCLILVDLERSPGEGRGVGRERERPGSPQAIQREKNSS